MIALIGNLSLGELVVVAVLAVLIFGGRLPEVAARGVHHFRRFRRALDDLRRETGIDREIRNIEYEIREAERQAQGANPFPPKPPEGLRQPRTEHRISPEPAPQRETEPPAEPRPEAGAEAEAGTETGPGPEVRTPAEAGAGSEAESSAGSGAGAESAAGAGAERSPGDAPTDRRGD